MINVRFFGIIRLNSSMSSINIEAKNVYDLIKSIAKQIDSIDHKLLCNSIIFVNGTDIAQLKGFKTKLNPGDDVQFFSPVSGG